MKKLISIIVALAMVPLVPISASAEDDLRVWQWSKEDKKTPSSFSKDRDLKSYALGIAPEAAGDRFQFFITVEKNPTLGSLSETSFVELFFDTNLDKKSDYSIRFTNMPDDGYAHSVDILDSAGQIVPNCEPYIWAIEEDYATSFNADCIKPRSEVNFSVRSTDDGSRFDFMPDNRGWDKLKTKYMSVAECKSSERNKKTTYQGNTYICMKSGSKWAWKDYAPIAAKNAKWLTEKAFYACKLDSKYGATLEDGGKTLTLDGAFKYIITEKDYNCVTRTLKMPASVERRVGMTRALDGVQEAKWGRISAFWNYHPDSGLNITFSYN